VSATSHSDDEFALLRAVIAEQGQQIQAMQVELDETNHGVLALYSELDNQAEQLRVASQRSNSKFLTIYAQAPSGIALVGDDGVVADANPAMLRLLGRRFDEVVGAKLSAMAPSEWAFRLDAFSTPAASPTPQELPMQLPDGRLVYVEWNVSAQIEPGLTMVVATDISARIELERQRVQWLDRERVARGDAEQTSRLKDDFIAVLSHELRTPLNAILSWAHVLQKRGGSDETVRGLAAIERNGRTQARMIADLLDMSRLNMGKLPLTFALLDPAEELAAALDALRPAFEEKDIRLEVRQRPPYRPIRADASRLQQVIWNLATNAIKFSPRGSVTTAVLTEEADGVRVEIVDAGQGIAPDFLPFVFDRFAQSDAPSNRTRGGLGLGLSIVKQLVEAHGGRVSARSAGLGQGSTFEVWLPTEPLAGDGAAEPRLETPEAPTAAEEPLEGLEIVVVDDDAEASGMLQIILADRGARVRVASGVDEALRLFDSAWPDVLVSDIGMPGRDGYDLVREVRRRQKALDPATRPRLAAIALTSFSRPQYRAQALAAGFDEHCSKPLRPLNLVQQIAQSVEAARRRER